MAFPIEEAVAVLARAAAAAPGGPADDTELHLRVARALDVFAANGLAVAPERILPRIAASDDPSRSSLDLMVAVLTESQRCAAAVIARAKEIAAAASDLPEEARSGHAARRVLVEPATEIARYLPREAVAQNDFRREELARAWMAAIGVAIESTGKEEPKERSERSLARLDYRKIKA
ncbi:MAG: hypothetical protein ACXWP4_03000, partial [Polyangiales bacterium]